MMNKKRKFDQKEEEETVNSLSSTRRLCDNVVFDILTRLPVKSLIRCTCVSKSWNSLIRCPSFIAAHKKLEQQQRRLNYLLHVPDYYQRTSPFVEHHQQCSNSNSKISILKLPFDNPYWVIGSCEGLVCIVNFQSQVYLCNPLLQIFKMVPPSPSELTNPKHFCIRNVVNNNVQLGLGYSIENNDYRIVKIVYTSFSTTTCSSNIVEIYSLKSDSWKSIDDCAAPGMVFPRSGVYNNNNGCINWPAVHSIVENRHMTNMCFDIDKESFGELAVTLLPYLPELSPSEDLKKLLRYYTTTTTIPTPPNKEEKELTYCSSSSSMSRWSDHKSLWKIKTLSCENSWVILDRVWDQSEKRMDVTAFDGTTMLRIECKNLISSLGFDELWEEEDNPKMRCHIVCMSESLMLFDHPN